MLKAICEMIGILMQPGSKFGHFLMRRNSTQVLHLITGSNFEVALFCLVGILGIHLTKVYFENKKLRRLNFFSIFSCDRLCAINNNHYISKCLLLDDPFVS